MMREKMAVILDCIGFLLSCLGIAIAAINNDIGWVFLFMGLGCISIFAEAVNFSKYNKKKNAS